MNENIKKKNNMSYMIISLIMIVLSVVITSFRTFLFYMLESNHDTYYLSGYFFGNYFMAIVLAIIIYFLSKKKYNFLFIFAVIALIASFGGFAEVISNYL